MPANWYSPWLPQPGDLYVDRPYQLGGGTATLLAMTDAEKEAVGRKQKRALGFTAVDPLKTEPTQANQGQPEVPMWEMG